MVLNDVLQGTAHHQNGEEGHNPVYSRNVYESNEINYMRSNSICNAFLWQTTAFFLKKRGNRIKLKFKRCDKDRFMIKTIGVSCIFFRIVLGKSRISVA
jgi:hypothetical protein